MNKCYFNVENYFLTFTKYMSFPKSSCDLCVFNYLKIYSIHRAPNAMHNILFPETC